MRYGKNGLRHVGEMGPSERNKHLELWRRVQHRVGGDALEEALEEGAALLEPLRAAPHPAHSHPRHRRRVLLRERRQDGARIARAQLRVQPVKVAEAAGDGELAVLELWERCLRHHLVCEVRRDALPHLGRAAHCDQQLRRGTVAAGGAATARLDGLGLEAEGGSPSLWRGRRDVQVMERLPPKVLAAGRRHVMGSA